MSGGCTRLPHPDLCYNTFGGLLTTPPACTVPSATSPLRTSSRAATSGSSPSATENSSRPVPDAPACATPSALPPPFPSLPARHPPPPDRPAPIKPGTPEKKCQSDGDAPRLSRRPAARGQCRPQPGVNGASLGQVDNPELGAAPAWNLRARGGEACRPGSGRVRRWWRRSAELFRRCRHNHSGQPPPRCRQRHISPCQTARCRHGLPRCSLALALVSPGPQPVRPGVFAVGASWWTCPKGAADGAQGQGAPARFAAGLDLGGGARRRGLGALHVRITIVVTNDYDSS